MSFSFFIVGHILLSQFTYADLYKMGQEIDADKTSCYQQLLLKHDCNTAAKLYQINTDIARLHQKAQSQGLTLHQIRSAAEPILKITVAKQRRSQISSLWLSAAIVVSVITAIFCYNPTYRLACSYTRLLFIKVGQCFVVFV